MLLETIICTHNRIKLLERMLCSLQTVVLPQQCQLLITVVANACNDGTESRIGALTLNNPKRRLRCIIEPKAGKSHALNNALSSAEGDWLCFVDDDHRLDPYYFAAIVQGIHSHPKVAGFCGRILPDWDGQEPGWAHRADRYAIYPLPVPCFDLGDKQQPITLQTRIPGGGNLVLSRSSIPTVGEFNTNLGPVGHNLIGAEDLDYVRRFLDQGHHMAYLPSMIQYHWVDVSRFSLRYLLNKAYWRSKDSTQLHQPIAEQIPRFLWRKLGGYLVQLCWPLPIDRARFYLVRIAATLGEISGFRQTALQRTVSNQTSEPDQ